VELFLSPPAIWMNSPEAKKGGDIISLASSTTGQGCRLVRKLRSGDKKRGGGAAAISDVKKRGLGSSHRGK
jgi:hypothetical protein